MPKFSDRELYAIQVADRVLLRMYTFLSGWQEREIPFDGRSAREALHDAQAAIRDAKSGSISRGTRAPDRVLIYLAGPCASTGEIMTASMPSRGIPSEVH